MEAASLVFAMAPRVRRGSVSRRRTVDTQLRRRRRDEGARRRRRGGSGRDGVSRRWPVWDRLRHLARRRYGVAEADTYGDQECVAPAQAIARATRACAPQKKGWIDALTNYVTGAGGRGAEEW